MELSTENDEVSDEEQENKEELHAQLRQLYAKKQFVAYSLESLEQRIYDEEESYLLKHQQFGNIVQGINVEAMLTFNPHRNSVRIGRQRTTTSSSNGTGNSRYSNDKGQFANGGISACNFPGTSRFPDLDPDKDTFWRSSAESCSTINMSAAGNTEDNVIDTETDFALESSSLHPNASVTQSSNSLGRFRKSEFASAIDEKDANTTRKGRRIPSSVRIFSNSSVTSSAAVFGHSPSNDDNPSAECEQVSLLNSTLPIKDSEKELSRKSCKRKKERCKAKAEEFPLITDAITSSLWPISTTPATTTSNAKNKKTTKKKHKDKRKHKHKTLKTATPSPSATSTSQFDFIFKKEEHDIDNDLNPFEDFTLNSFLENYEDDDGDQSNLLLDYILS